MDRQSGKMSQKKDNLDTHRKKHDRVNVYRCNICFQHFFEPESLELHHTNTHLVRSEEVKSERTRKLWTPVKRKLTTFDNPEDMYTIMVIGEHRMPKFNTTSTRLPSGGIGKRCKYVDLEKTLNEKRCFLQIQNKDDLCCARAIMTAKARLDGHEKWNSIRQGRKLQGESAKELHNKAGVPFRRCGVEEIKSFQRILDGYQIHVVSKRAFQCH
ncbi:Hypothetical predicted protein [Mytilus galloprovincialis]|uniref:C2H2-type domain-containing protein n=1 Tax=Mytilus galloprovincialis TaxID=29158 RepID=A0A8B6BY91_MYTGA|nr:Hypothetical predicted protein [Mytilus galloprovincialis]